MNCHLGWHVFLAFIGQIWGYLFMRWKFRYWSEIARILTIALVVLSTGVWYEISQGWQWDVWQDLAGNMAGVLLGIITIWWFEYK